MGEYPRVPPVPRSTPNDLRTPTRFHPTARRAFLAAGEGESGQLGARAPANALAPKPLAGVQAEAVRRRHAVAAAMNASPHSRGAMNEYAHAA